MSAISCGQCSRELPASEAYELNGKAYCATCIEPAIQAAAQSGQPTSVIRLVDKSICARCNTYSSTLLEVGPLRMCEPCTALVQDWPYPQWLKLSLAGLCLLLAFALLHGRKYFEAGKNLYRGEQLVEKGQYAQSLKYLKETLRIAPESDKGVLLTAKAALLSGDIETAQKALNNHNEGKFEDATKPEFIEVETLWKRAVTAEDKLRMADVLYKQDGKEGEAAALAHEAASLYPQLPGMQLIVDYYDEGAAFNRKDYDSFLRLAERDWNTTASAGTAAALASALACKFAVTNDPAYRQRSEEMLAKAKELYSAGKSTQADFSEFEERTRYRLNSREIITKSEYDRRFPIRRCQQNRARSLCSSFRAN
jgi:tetratricopeptide (TPR) repeat protein